MANTDRKRTSRKSPAATAKYFSLSNHRNMVTKALRVHKRITAYAKWWFKHGTHPDEPEGVRNERVKKFKLIKERARVEALKCALAHGTSVEAEVARTLQSR